MLEQYASHLCSGTGGSIGQSRFICHVLCTVIHGISTLVLGRGSIGQSRFICQVLCTGMQGISALVPGGSLAKEGSSTKFCVAVFKNLCFIPRGSSGQSRFICQVLCSGKQVISALVLGGPSAQVGSSAMCCVLLFMASLLWYWGGGSIGQSRFICQVLCTGMQGISALVPGGSLAKEGSSTKFCVAVFKNLCFIPRGSSGQSRFICQVLCSGKQVISALVLGGPSAQVGSSAKFCVLVIKASLSGTGGSIG